MEPICSCQDPSVTYTEYGGGFTKTEISNISGLICIRVSTTFSFDNYLFSNDYVNHLIRYIDKHQNYIIEYLNFSVVNVLLSNNPKITIHYKNCYKILPITKKAGFKLSPMTICTSTNC